MNKEVSPPLRPGSRLAGDPEPTRFGSRGLRRSLPRTLMLALAVLLSGAFTAGADPPAGTRWPYPLAETERVIGRWLANAGFEVARASDEAGIVKLSAVRGSDRREVLLRPCSALATCVSAVAVSGAADPADERALRELLDRYAAGALLDHPLRDDEVPPAVLARRASVVCLEVRKGDALLRFSGFVVGRGAWILATAHDLEGVAEVGVTWADGTMTKGPLVRVDREMDLALIEVPRRPGAEVSLKGARGLLRDGEFLFSIGCPTGPQETVRSGRVRTPMRRVNNQRLWQVEMETLSGGSGSPVFDASGNLAGVVKGRLRGTENAGFIIPMDTVLRFLDKP